MAAGIGIGLCVCDNTAVSGALFDETPSDWPAWPKRPTADQLRAYPTDRGYTDLPRRLAELPAVDAVAYASGPNEVRLVRADGEVSFRQPDGPGGLITYDVVSGPDPLGWHDSLPADFDRDRAHAPRAWLTATVSSPYPGLPAPLLAYFRSRRAGDLAVFAALDWDFGCVNRAGHGSLGPGDMQVPLMLAGPGVPVRRLDVAQTVTWCPRCSHYWDRRCPLDWTANV